MVHQSFNPRRPSLVQSSAVLAIAYFQFWWVLDVTFHGGAVYRYFGVDGLTFEEFSSAPSKGQFFNDRVRNRFPYVRLACVGRIPASQFDADPL